MSNVYGEQTRTPALAPSTNTSAVPRTSPRSSRAMASLQPAAVADAAAVVRQPRVLPVDEVGLPRADGERDRPGEQRTAVQAGRGLDEDLDRRRP